MDLQSKQLRIFSSFLPHAYLVCVKVMFSVMSVCLFTGRSPYYHYQGCHWSVTSHIGTPGPVQAYSLWTHSPTTWLPPPSPPQLPLSTTSGPSLPPSRLPPIHLLATEKTFLLKIVFGHDKFYTSGRMTQNPVPKRWIPAIHYSSDTNCQRNAKNTHCHE